ncbi:MAG: hypothetical protein QOG59_863 [Solirubrobacteraceae bacterium]|jgi:hypothetical protein|nr:hypothetical protein [Solirubrobacteraceae bacterium]
MSGCGLPRHPQWVTTPGRGTGSQRSSRSALLLLELGLRFEQPVLGSLDQIGAAAGAVVGGE